MALPSYDELPIRPELPAGSSWGVWGDDDVFGTLNLLTPDRARAAAAAVVSGETFALNLEMELPGPPLFGRSAFSHAVHGTAVSNDDELSGWNTQSSSQWDGFRHIRHRAHGHYNGLADEQHGIHHWARKGIVGRGVIADVARHRDFDPAAPTPIEPEDVQGALDAQGVVVEEGDILLIRTGWLSWYRALSDEGRAGLAAGQALTHCGLRPGRKTAGFLWDLHIAAVAADNPALEVWPPGVLLGEDARSVMMGDPEESPEFFVHFSLLPLLGLPIGELFNLDPLADACAAAGRYAFLFTSAPLNLHQGVASPPNALAIL